MGVEFLTGVVVGFLCCMFSLILLLVVVALLPKLVESKQPEAPRMQLPNMPFGSAPQGRPAMPPMPLGAVTKQKGVDPP